MTFPIRHGTLLAVIIGDRAMTGVEERHRKQVASQVRTANNRKKRLKARWLKTEKEKKLTGQKARRKYRLRREFNITVKQYEEMRTAQRGCCAICGGVNKNKRRLCVDHNHKTGVIRGLLCNKCNTLIGCADDSIAVLEATVDYLLLS